MAGYSTGSSKGYMHWNTKFLKPINRLKEPEAQKGSLNHTLR
jgi:hypothetical protein